MATTTLDKFLGEMGRLMRVKDGAEIQNYLQYEPPWSRLYSQMVTELRQTFPEFQQAALERHCAERLPENEDEDGGGSYTSFVTFLVKYFTFIRDVDINQLLETHDKLKALLGLVRSWRLVYCNY